MSAAPDRRWPPAWATGLGGGDADETAVYLALEAASWPRELAAGERRAFALLVLASCDARQDGATRLSLGDDLGSRLERLGARPEDRAAALALAARLGEHAGLAALIGGAGDYRPFILDDGFLYQERDLRREVRLSDALASRLAAPDFPVVDLVAARAAASVGDRRWTAGQAAAIDAALRRPLAVITGGPGSGKTAVIGGILQAWRAAGLVPEAIAVAAPTGKAANRIAEALGSLGGDGIGVAVVPGTLHRLLGFAAHPGLGGGEFRRHENNPLPHAAVIVDEASMVDLALLDQLTRALRPDARLVLVGDADQLPAIQAGSVFRDLDGAALRLTESHRMSPDDPDGAAILAAARQVATGTAPSPVASQDRTSGASPAGVGALDALRWRGFELVEPGPGPHGHRRLVAAFMERWAARLLDPTAADHEASKNDAPPSDPATTAALPVARLDGGGLDPASAAAARTLLARHGRARLLTVTRVGPFGADRLNELLAARAAAALPSPPTGDPVPGTPVMMIENDYDRGLMNGDQGIILLAAIGGRAAAPTVVFARDGGLTTFPLATLRGALAIAYATTVHKAQGSELDRAALILPDVDLPILSRELVYTAVTRARRGMIVLGRVDLLARAAARPLGRASGLAQRLTARGALAEPPPRG